MYNSNTELWETTVTQGTFVRDVQATITWAVGLTSDSQFYSMITAEENYHKYSQIENPSHSIWGTAYLVNEIMNDVQANEPYTDATEQGSLDEARQAFQEAKDDEIDRSAFYIYGKKCDLEEEAKNAAGSSHCCSLECGHPECQ